MDYHKKWREEHSDYFLDYYKQNKAHIIETLLKGGLWQNLRMLLL